jgi:two-component system LytT family response regulator
MKCIIIDDEIHCIGTLEILLQKYFPEIEIIATCKNGAEGILAIEKCKPDFILLDISMPKMNGFEMLSRIKKLDFSTIFTTAYDNYAIEAFKVSAIDYLLKPIEKTDLRRAISKLQKGIDPNAIQAQLHSFLENFGSMNANFPNLALPTLSGYEMVKIEDIVHIESDSNYSVIYFLDGTKKTITRTLKELEIQLKSYSFVRIHRSNMINLLHLREYIKGEGGYVILKNGQHLDVSRRKKEQLINSLNRTS